MAISQSEIPDSLALMIRVETGAADDVREYMDTGVPRTLDDRVELHPDHQINKLLAQLCSYAWVDRLAATNRTRFAAKRPSPDDFKEWFSQHREAALAISRMHKRDRGVGTIQIAYAAMEYWEINQGKAEAFYSSLFMADGPVQPARMLRDWVLRTVVVRNAKDTTGASPRSAVYRRSVYCMKAHLRSKTIASVREAKWE